MKPLRKRRVKYPSIKFALLYVSFSEMLYSIYCIEPFDSFIFTRSDVRATRGNCLTFNWHTLIDYLFCFDDLCV